MTITPAEDQRRPPAMEPEQLEEWEFPLVRRGYDPDLVRVVLLRAADELRSLAAGGGGDAEEVVALRARLQDAEAAMAQAQARQVALDAELHEVRAERGAALAEAADEAAQREAALAALGDEIAQLETMVRSLRAELHDALEARGQAEAELGRVLDERSSESVTSPSADGWDRVAAEVASVLRGADQDAARLRSDADAHAVEVRRAAEEAAAELRADADRYAAELTAQTDAWATQRLAKADRELAAARADLEAARTEAVAVRHEARAAADALAGAVAEHLRGRVEAVRIEVGERVARSERSWAELRQQLDAVAVQVERARGSVGASPVVGLDLADALAMIDGQLPSAGDGTDVGTELGPHGG